MALAGYWGFTHGPEAGLMMMLKVLAITAILAVMEVSLSFDNAVVNASVLKHWDQFWRTLFLTVGIIVAVFGMRLIFGEDDGLAEPVAASDTVAVGHQDFEDLVDGVCVE